MDGKTWTWTGWNDEREARELAREELAALGELREEELVILSYRRPFHHPGASA
jgi:hypothetical protein